MIVSISELQAYIFTKFKQVTAGEFGISKVEFSLKTEHLVVYIEHYKDVDITFKISFDKILSYVVLQDYLQETRDEANNSQTFSSAILKQVDGTKYMDYLNKWTDLKIFFDGEALEKVKQYSIYSQNVMMDIVTDCQPVIEILNSTSEQVT